MKEKLVTYEYVGSTRRPAKKMWAGQSSELAGLHRYVDRLASPHKIKTKKFVLVYINYFFMDFCINVPNSCITEKDKYYLFFNVLKCKEYIVYVIV